MRRARLLWVVATLLTLCAAPGADAQVRRDYWGVSGGITPRWATPDYQEVLLDAEQADFRGSELRIGVVRGNVMSGDWGVSFIRRDIADRAAAVVKSDGTVLSTSHNSLVGVELHAFKPFATIKERVQIGLSFGGGVGSYRKTVLRTSPNGFSELVDAKLLFSPGDHEVAVTPIGRLELAAAAILGPHLKVRVGGGINFPGQQPISLTAVYLF